MSIQFSLVLQNRQEQEQEIRYQLVDNPIAQQWFQKIKHLVRVPLCRHYTSVADTPATNQELYNIISYDIKKLNEILGPVYEIKNEYNQNDCNAIHALTVYTQYQYSPKIRDIFHHLHRQVHRLERNFNNIVQNRVHIGWGEKEGLLKTTFTESPYPYYNKKLSPGNLYMMWNEFGKTPYTYWIDRDLDNVEHFMATCKPQITARAEFVLCYRSITHQEFDTNFYTWFESYRLPWMEKYGIVWTPTHEYGGVPLATPVMDYDFLNINTVQSVNL